MLTPLTGVDPRISLCETGLALGGGTRLAQFAGATDRLVIDHERLEAMFAVAFRRAPSNRDLSAIEAASTHWQRGDKALANLRLVFADLPRLDDRDDKGRQQWLLSNGDNEETVLLTLAALWKTGTLLPGSMTHFIERLLLNNSCGGS